MFRKLILATVTLALGVTTVSAQVLPYPREVPPTPSQPQYQPPFSQSGYWVQFRQPSWRQQTFATEFEMANFINTQRPLGWEVQVLPPSPFGGYTVRYRLTQWGGSRTVATMGEAQQWAAYLTDLGYEPRIMPLSP